MSHSALLIAPPHEHADDDKGGSNRLLPQMQLVEDLRLAERVERALHATGYASLRAVVVSVNARVVVLLGRVPSYYLKQVAQVTALATVGTHQIYNGLEVIPPI